MNWLDKLLMKIAVAKAAARWGVEPMFTAIKLIAAFEEINSASADTSRSDDPGERK